MSNGASERYLCAAAGLGASMIAMLLVLLLDDSIIGFGALIALAHVLLALALRPVIAMLGFIGQVLFWTLIATALVSIAGHLARPLPNPWSALWGVELYLIGVVCLLALIAAVVAFVVSARPVWAVLLLGLTPVLAYAGIAAYGPWPHAAVIPLGASAALLALSWREPLRMHRTE